MEFKTKYAKSIDFLDDRFAYFLTHVLNMGQPKLDGRIPTAAVILEKETDDEQGNFKFVFNKDFADKLDVDECAFIMAHETMHILLNHLRLSKRFPDKDKFNIAADCLVNDYLENCALFAPEGVAHGEETVGYNCAYSTVSQIYDDITDETMQKYKQPGEIFVIDDHGWMHIKDWWQYSEMMERIAKGAGIPKSLEELRKDIHQKSDIKKQYKLAGVGTSGVTNFMEDTGVGLAWAKLLEKIDPDALDMFRGNPWKASFHRRPKKLGAFPDLMLPVRKRDNRQTFGERKLVFMALDTSGSIGDVTANYFVNLARSVKKTNIKLEVITFTDSARELDVDNPIFHSGGTAFGCIERWIDDQIIPKYKKYPSAVVVITDGHADFHDYRRPEDKKQSNWLWLLTDSGLDPATVTNQFFGEAEYLSKYTVGK